MKVHTLCFRKCSLFWIKVKIFKMWFSNSIFLIKPKHFICIFKVMLHYLWCPVTSSINSAIFSFLATPTACESSQVRDQTHTRNSSLSFCSDNAGSPTRCTTRELLNSAIFITSSIIPFQQHNPIFRWSIIWFSHC